MVASGQVRAPSGPSQAHWQAILDAAIDAIVCIDRSGTITVFNLAAEEMFGYAAGEVLGKHVEILLASPDREKPDRYLTRSRGTDAGLGLDRVREMQARRKNGEVFPIEVAVSEARTEDQVVYSAIVRDVSGRRAMETALADAQRLAQQRERLADIGAITARIVHDLGNPLAGLSMQAQLIHRRVVRDPERPMRDLAGPAARIVSEVKRLDGLVREFLEFVRQQRLELRAVRLASLLGQVVEFWQPAAAARAITLTLDATPEVGEVTADADKLRHVLDDLVRNAVEAIGEGPGTIVVRLRRTAQGTRITVADSGPGVPEHVVVFRLFETTKRNGTGLGLPIAKQIVLAHGGTIGFERLTPRGTAFHVDLPAHDAAM